MNEVFDYEFDGPVTRFTRYGKPIYRDEVVEILNLLTDALSQIEYINGEAMADSTVAHKTYRAACEALNKARIGVDK